MVAVLFVIAMTMLRIVIPFGLVLLIGTLVKSSPSMAA